MYKKLLAQRRKTAMQTKKVKICVETSAFLSTAFSLLTVDYDSNKALSNLLDLILNSLVSIFDTN
jgi:hypothetical protein